MSRNNQLTNLLTYNTNQMLFSEPVPGSVPDSVPLIKFKRINISTLNNDGTTGDLIISTHRVFSFGVSENKSQETGKVNGLSLSLCLYNKDGPTDEEKLWVENFDKVINECKNHLLENKNAIEKYDLVDVELRKLNPLYWKTDKGVRVPNTGPTLYAKLIESKKHNKILSMFYNERNEDLDPLSLIGKYCMVKCALKIESIFVGAKISMQIKVFEADVEILENSMKPLLRTANRIKPGPVVMALESNTNDMMSSDDMKTTEVVGRSGSIPDDEPTEKVKRKIAKKLKKNTVV